MTSDEQRIAIAKACGWTSCANIPGEGIIGVPPKAQVCSEDLTMIPWFESDLNAMHEAENTVPPEQRWAYAKALFCVIESGGALSTSFAALHATAAQRAEAFLRTIGKWTAT